MWCHKSKHHEQHTDYAYGGKSKLRARTWQPISLECPPLKVKDQYCDDIKDGDVETVLDQLYQAYAESHESDSPEISEGFKELECFLESLPLSDNNAVFNLCCRLCTAYEEKAFRHGLLYGAHLMQELFTKEDSY